MESYYETVHWNLFESTKLEYQEELRKSCYKSTLKCKPKNTPGKSIVEILQVKILYGSIYHLAKMSPQA